MNRLVKRSAMLFLGLPLLASACAATATPAVTPAPPAVEAAAPTTAPSAGKLRVLATFSVIGDLVQNVVGDKAEVVTLVGPDSDTHEFEPAPADAAKLVDAQVIFENGLEFESWLDNLYQSSGSKAVRVVVSAGIQPRSAEAEGEQHAGEGEKKEGAEEHEHGEFDPHVWQDPRNTIQMVKNIRDGLSKADPANTETYTANAGAYLAKLDALDKEITAEIEKLPRQKRKLVTSHDALGYFADRFGFEVVGNVIGSAVTTAGEPSAQEFAKLVDDIKAQGVSAIFLESITNPALVERVSKEAGVKVGPELYTDALGAPGSEGSTYLDAMRYNVKSIVVALK